MPHWCLLLLCLYTQQIQRKSHLVACSSHAKAGSQSEREMESKTWCEKCKQERHTAQAQYVINIQKHTRITRIHDDDDGDDNADDSRESMGQRLK